MPNNDQFTFQISLSVLNHLGRHLYRSFITVLGEAISNAWDADAKNVWIYIDKKKNGFVIKDDGIGMTALDFQNKFLKIGYSKRNQGEAISPGGRPYIGRKGIGKLALLSCANKITVISKIKDQDYIGGIIDNTNLDKAITDDLTAQEYILEKWAPHLFRKYIKSHKQGTVIHFDNIKSGVKSSLEHIKKMVALYFRFSLVDNSFNIYIDDEKIDYKHLADLASNTEFLWKINSLKDPYLDKKLKNPKEEKTIKMKSGIKGFIASVAKPRDLKIIATEEKVSVDLFVNGRLREKDILRHIPTARVVESYLYGQIHFDGLDDKEDRFTSSREGIVADDPKYKQMLEELRRKVIASVLEDWDQWRRENKEDGDSDNDSISRTQRKSGELFNAVAAEFIPAEGSKNQKKIDELVGNLHEDAQYNFASYAECFVAENLIRKYIHGKNIPFSDESKNEISDMKKREAENKGKGNISIEIRRANIDLSYLSMDGLANLVDKKDPNKEACLSRDAKEYKPVRDALMHTALLSDLAKKKLNTVYENIKGRVIKLLS